MQVRKQQLELDMEQQTGSKQEKEYIKTVYCYPAYLTYMQSTSYFVPLIYISVFVPVPCYLDDCGFVVEPEVRQVDSSSSILLSEDCCGYSRFFFFVFPYKL